MSILPKSVKSKVPFLPRLDSRFIEVEKDDAADEDLFEEPPCLCAQQLICTLFGAILGYAAVLVTPAQLFWPMAIAQVNKVAVIKSCFSCSPIFLLPTSPS